MIGKTKWLKFTRNNVFHFTKWRFELTKGIWGFAKHQNG